MVGQKKILEDLKSLKESNNFPRFIILSGVKGSGRKTVSRYISKLLNGYLIECELGVDSVREAVHNCYKCSVPTVYQFADADKMSLAAKNALLKITEEPPRQAYFVITVQMAENMLETLRSRAMCVQMAPYTEDELYEFVQSEGITLKDDRILDVSDVPGQVLAFNSIDFEDMWDYCSLIIDNVKTVTGVNAFKIVNKVRIKEDKEGYDPELFFQCLKSILRRRIMEGFEENLPEMTTWANMLKVTSKYHREFNLTGVKKDSTLDMWILEMRNT